MSELINSPQLAPAVGFSHAAVAGQTVYLAGQIGTLPDGTPATGHTINLSGASFTQVEGDKIRSEEIYFDRQNLFEQLGLKAK